MYDAWHGIMPEDVVSAYNVNAFRNMHVHLDCAQCESLFVTAIMCVCHLIIKDYLVT